MTALRLIVLVTTLIIGGFAEVHGQTPPVLPPGMTQEQFDAVVDAIGKALVVKLKSEGALPASASAPAQAHAQATGNVVADELAAFLDKSERSLRAVPTLGRYLAAIPDHLDEAKHGGRGVVRFLV